MTQKIKNLIAAVLVVPTLVFGLLVVTPASPVFAACTQAEIISGASGCNGIDGGADTNNKAGGVKCLFGTDSTGKPCVLTTVINFALYFIGAISVLMLIIGGVRYTISGGNDKAVAAAKNTILYAVIGVVVALLAYAIVNFVLGTFTTA